MEYTLRLEIERPLAAIAELFGDPENFVFWHPGFLERELIDPKGERSGSRSRLRYLHNRKEIELIETIERDDLPGEYTVTYEGPGMVMRVANYFRELGPDRTEWVTVSRAHASGIVMRIIRVFMPGCFRLQTLKFMENFKTFAEDGSDIRDC